MATETLNFQAEVSKLLHIVTHSLYSDKEIFLRELISNASDACDRLRYLAITDAELTGDDSNFQISITVDAKAKTVTVEDNGIGMNRQELIDNLGTIARSGSSTFAEQMTGDVEHDMSLIGQFGVGFYAAFMVSDRVEVISRRAGEAEAWKWESDGSGAFDVAEATKESRGTSIILHIRKAEKEFLDPDRLKQIVKTYSDHISIPISICDSAKEDDGSETVNAASALWTRGKSEITDEQYKEFYHHVGHGFDDPWATIHAKAEGKIEYTMLLFVPSAKPFDLFSPERKNHLRLYVKRVFITDDCEDLVPAYLRFLRGIIDSEDLPLNVSRELLQNNPLLAKIRKAVVKRVLTELERKAKKAPEEFAGFWENFGAVVKEGIYEDAEMRERLLKLARFRSSLGPGLTTLEDYVGRMKDGQESIFYITGTDAEAIEKSPQLEGFAAKNVEVLLLSDPVDDFWLGAVPEFDGKPFKSVTRAGTDLSQIKGDEAEKPDAGDDPNISVLIAAFKQALENEIKDVKASDRLTDSPACLVADDGDMDIHLERILRAHKQLDTAAQRILEINPRHALIQSLNDKVKADGISPLVEDAAKLLLDHARIIEGEPLADPAAFARRMADFMTRGLTAA